MKKKTHREVIDGWHPFSTEEIERYVSSGVWQNDSVCDLLARNADIFPDKLALADDSQEVTWKELQTRVDRTALHLIEQGVEYGDFFVLQMANVVEFFYLFLGLNRIGAVPVMCLPRHRELEVNYEIELHRAKGICVMAGAGEKFNYVAMLEEIKGKHPYLKLLIGAGGSVPDGWLSLDDLWQQDIETRYPDRYLDKFQPDPNDICCEQLSGGTTGLPKGIPRTHNDYICEWWGYARLAGNTEESVVLITIPVAHNAAFITMSGPAMCLGGTIVLTRSPRPKESFAMIEKYGVTDTMLIPVQIVYWKEAKDERKQHNISSLRVMGAAAQKVRPELVEWCLTELGVDMVNHYGMGEGPLICNRWNSPREPQMHTVGFPLILDPDAQIKIFNDKNEEVATGEIGETVAKGFLNFRGYFRNPEENSKAFDDKGYFHTGDLMSRREDGRFVVEGRKKDMVICGGENVYPEAVEDLLVKHPKIMYATVVGMPDYRLGEQLCAFIQQNEGMTLSFEEMQQFMREHGVAIFKWPRRMEIITGWPLTPVNKIDKRRLRAHITFKLFEEGVVSKEFCDEYLKREKISIDDIESGKIKIEFTGRPK